MLKRDFSLPSPRTAISVSMDFKKVLPHVYAALILLAVAAIFFSPNFFGDKVLPQPDNDKARAIQTEIQDYIKKEGKAPLWTNSLFGGMPSYQIYTTPQGNLTRPLAKAAFLFADYTEVWASVFAAMLFMYLLLSVLNCNWLTGVFGALAFGITSYNVDILEAGHSTKMAALAVAPALMAAMVLLFRGRWIAGTGLLALFTAIEIYVNHLQITYYTFILMGIYGLALLVDAVLKKRRCKMGQGCSVERSRCSAGCCLQYVESVAHLRIQSGDYPRGVGTDDQIGKRKRPRQGLSFRLELRYLRECHPGCSACCRWWSGRVLSAD